MIEETNLEGHNSGEDQELDRDSRLAALSPQELDAIKTKIDRIEALEEERAVTNEELGTLRKELEAMGLNINGVNHGRQYDKFSEKRQDGYDMSVKIIRSVMGNAIQADLFDAA